MHVKGFTRHPSSRVKENIRGTYAGLAEKIPYPGTCRPTSTTSPATG